jgi:hypothetical protein
MRETARRDLSDVAILDELVVEFAYRADLMADWVRGINRLRITLWSIFPALEGGLD